MFELALLPVVLAYGAVYASRYLALRSAHILWRHGTVMLRSRDAVPTVLAVALVLLAIIARALLDAPFSLGELVIASVVGGASVLGCRVELSVSAEAATLTRKVFWHVPWRRVRLSRPRVWVEDAETGFAEGWYERLCVGDDEHRFEFGGCGDSREVRGAHHVDLDIERLRGLARRFSAECERRERGQPYR